jgi:lipopolysaccharide transport system ATP-binding protein
LKCFKTIDTILPNTAMVFVSHSMPMVSRICTQIILMDSGKPQFQGEDIAKAIDLYYTRFSKSISNVVFDDGSICLKEVKVVNSKTSIEITELNWGDDFKIYLHFILKKNIPTPSFSIVIFDKEQRPVAIFEKNNSSTDLILSNGELKFFIEHENLQLSKGVYTLNISANNLETKEPLLRINGIVSFQVFHQEEIWQPFLLKANFRNI